jgi:hypothetical protein
MKDQMETIQPIINGSVNPNLTQELFNELPFDTKKSVIWNIMVSMGFAHSFPGVDYRCYEKPDEEFLYSSITEENANDLFSTMREKYKAHHRRMLAKTKDLYYDMGQKIHSAQKELGFGGYVQLDAYRLKGYIDAGGSWNDFKSGVVGAAISKMDSLAPRRDYGVNNPNSGMSMHQWKVVHSCEYVILSYEFIDKKDLEKVQAFYIEHWEAKGRSIKADSVRIEINELDGNYYTVELIWWWD